LMLQPDLTGEPSMTSAQLNHHRGRGAPNITRVRATTDRTIIHPFRCFARAIHFRP
jgi:hypothetical protein